jgi:hypothetical protein
MKNISIGSDGKIKEHLKRKRLMNNRLTLKAQKSIKSNLLIGFLSNLNVEL